MAEVKKDLVARIMRLFLMYGLRSMTTNDIARELGISKKTLYEHFTDKSEIVREGLIMLHETFAVKFEGIIQKKQDAIDSMLQIYRLSNEILKTISPTFKYDLIKYYPELANELLGRFRETIYHIHVNNIKQGQAEGIYRDVDPEIIAQVLCFRMHESHAEMFNEELYSPEKVHKEVFFYHLFGVCNERGAAKVQEQLERLTNNSILTQQI